MRPAPMRPELHLRSARGAPRLCRRVLPYGVPPLAALAAVAIWRLGAERHLAVGVAIGCGILAGLAVAHRIIVLLCGGRTARSRDAEQELAQRVAQGIVAHPSHHTSLPDSLLHAAVVAQHDLCACSLLHLDLERGPAVDDPPGRRRDDRLLLQIAERLRQTVPASAVVARLGGAEFAILLPATGAGGAASLARALRMGLEKPFLIEDQPFSLGVSIGVSLCPPDGGQVPALSRGAMVAASAGAGGRPAFIRHDTAHDGYEYQATGERARELA